MTNELAKRVAHTIREARRARLDDEATAACILEDLGLSPNHLPTAFWQVDVFTDGTEDMDPRHIAENAHDTIRHAVELPVIDVFDERGFHYAVDLENGEVL